MRLIFVIALVTLFGSCTVQKRLHNPGWDIEWNKSYQMLKENSEDSPLNLKESSKSERTDLFKDSVFLIRDSKKISATELFKNKKTSLISTIPVQKNKWMVKDPAKEIVDNPDVVFFKNYKERKNTPTKQFVSKKTERDIDWELIGTIGLGILIVVVFGIALFGSGPLALIASILIAIGGLALLIAAVVCIIWFISEVLFGWMR